MSQAQERDRAELVAAIRQALSEGQQVVVETYCRNDRCATRVVHLHFKDYESLLVSDIQAHGLNCPLCGRILTLHWARGRETFKNLRDLDSRLSVNRQMYLRDQQAVYGDAFDGFLPASVMFKDALPPTPPGWWDQKARSDAGHPRSAPTGQRHWHATLGRNDRLIHLQLEHSDLPEDSPSMLPSESVMSAITQRFGPLEPPQDLVDSVASWVCIEDIETGTVTFQSVTG